MKTGENMVPCRWSHHHANLRRMGGEGSTHSSHSQQSLDKAQETGVLMGSHFKDKIT